MLIGLFFAIQVRQGRTMLLQGCIFRNMQPSTPGECLPAAAKNSNRFIQDSVEEFKRQSRAFGDAKVEDLHKKLKTQTHLPMTKIKHIRTRSKCG